MKIIFKINEKNKKKHNTTASQSTFVLFSGVMKFWFKMIFVQTRFASPMLFLLFIVT